MIATEELKALELAVGSALADGDHSRLQILGFGEISLVLGWPNPDPEFACKRLPFFADQASLSAYQATLEEYISALEEAGVDVVETSLVHWPLDADSSNSGKVVAYCVQEVLPADALVPKLLARSEPNSDHRVLQAIVAAVSRAVSPRVGFDAQLSNWALVDDQLRYLDITTPILSGPDGKTALDPAVFLSAYPWFMRGAIRRFLLPGILQRYHQVRSVLSDVCANLVKEDLENWLPATIDACNRVLDEPLTEDEVRKDYKSDARMWAAMQRLRRWDRTWQQTVRRRTYPFLLPTAFQR